MLILAIDSAGAGCGVCVWQNGVVLARAQEGMERGQDGRLVPMIIEAMKKARITFGDLDRIAVTRGPGSFTGLRVGLSTARGIGLAAGKPVIGIDRFSIYRNLHKDKGLLVVIDSRRVEMFCKFYPAEGGEQEAQLMTQMQIDAFKNVKVVGDQATPNDDVLASCALLAAEAQEGNPKNAASPLYLREPDVTFAAARSR